MSMRRGFSAGSKALVGTLAVALAVTACGGAASGSDAGADAAAATVDRNATLRMAWTVAPGNLDPHQSGNYQVDFNYLSPVYDRLTVAVAGPEIKPMLAESWSFSPDGNSVDFTLRTDATFHDGTPVDAAAVVKSLNRARDPQKAKSASTLSMISDIQQVGDNTVRIVTNRPAADLPAVLSSTTAAIINPIALEGGADLSVETAGSGPYIPQQIRRGDRIVYERYDGYWDPEAQKAATLEIAGITDDNSRLNAFRSGQIDVMLAKAGQTDDLQTLLAQPQYDMHTYPIAQFYALQMDIGQVGLQDPKVRQALNLAIDRDGINAALLEDQCQPVFQPLPEGIDGHNADLDGIYPYDPAKARQLLDEAGVDNLTIRVITVAGLSPQQEIATALQAQLAEVGVTLELMPMSNADAQVRMGEGGYALLNPRLAFPTPAQTLQTNYMTKLRFPSPPSQEFQDSVTRAFDPNLDDGQRTELYSKASTIASKAAYDVFLCGIPTQVAYTDKVVGADKGGQADFVGIVDTRYMGITS
ncbi:ABC transporter substrate-binding protein [Rhodococcus oxybenzonivorans]|uniref:ABC transporter substrate-binding protein n=1 Tax=Rhodococcus oxybenzonivorans TaxID=1990687 RepID=UPI00295347E6|nr:ABC transporter substrate-binding protein [Rhodococcus oxybenzonivorans]MDV7352765.1 ABC transporter substrate-binding protein [Rhodococcus oxybenzonivorans]